MVGNKADLEQNRTVSKAEGEKYKMEHNLDLFMETSAKTGYNAKNVLVEAAKVLYKDYLNFEEKNGKQEENKDNKKILKEKLINKDQKSRKKCC